MMIWDMWDKSFAQPPVQNFEQGHYPV